MPRLESPLHGWYLATVRSSDTPLALGFEDGQPVYVGKEAWDTIILNDTQIRHVTETQARVALQIGQQIPEDTALAHYRTLRAKILKSPNGLLVPWNKPKEVPLPKGFPTHFPVVHPRAYQIHAADCSPVVSKGRWEADWTLTVDRTGSTHGHIWWQAEWLDKLWSDRAWPLIHMTHQHEFFEGSITKPLTYLLYEDAALEQVPGLALQLQGWTHKLTLETVDGFDAGNGGEPAFNRWDERLGAQHGMSAAE